MKVLLKTLKVISTEKNVHEKHSLNISSKYWKGGILKNVLIYLQITYINCSFFKV